MTQMRVGRIWSVAIDMYKKLAFEIRLKNNIKYYFQLLGKDQACKNNCIYDYWCKRCTGVNIAYGVTYGEFSLARLIFLIIKWA